MVRADELEYKGEDSWGRQLFKCKTSGEYYCFVEEGGTLSAAVAGQIQLYFKGRDPEGEPEYPVGLLPARELLAAIRETDIVIKLDGGIPTVAQNPSGCRIIIRDYEIPDLDRDEACPGDGYDEQGELCHQQVYEPGATDPNPVEQEDQS